MTSDWTSDDLSLDLYAEWEDRQASGDPVSLEEVCSGYPDSLPRVRAIAQRLAGGPVSLILPTLAHEQPSTTNEEWVEIGRGASSVVYRGGDPDFGTTVAYKVLHPSDQLLSAGDLHRLLRRFEQEARILARLKHESIVRIYKTFFRDGRPVLEMEYLPGGTLAERVEDVRRLGPVAIARVLERVARAVGFAHRHGIIHRDLKPSNILLDATGQPCVSDFGVAKLLDPGEATAAVVSVGASDIDPGLSTITVLGRQPGTRAYKAPEQFDPAFGPVTPATDVWALGVILSELLTGSRPFAGCSEDECRDAVCRHPRPRAGRWRWGQTGRLLRIAQRCLARDPKERFPTAIELADELAGVFRRRSWSARLAVGAVVIVTGLAAVLGLTLWQSGRTTEPAAPPRAGRPPAWEHASVEQSNRARLQRGETVTLVPAAANAPVAYRIVAGEPTIESGRDGATVHCQGLGLVELMPHLPATGRYRVRGTLTHRRADGYSSMGGLFVGGSGRWNNDATLYRCGVTSLAEIGPLAGN
jgi:tRNA A-37 threonylcarbamoyl transferase component Bud32